MDYSLFERAGRKPTKLDTDLVEALEQGKISRRTFVTRGSVLGLSLPLMGSILAACGGDDDDDAAGDTQAAGDTGEAPAETEAPAASAGGVIKVGSQRPGGPLDPVAMADLGTYTVVVTAFEYLCGPGEGADLAPMLAESWTPNDDGSVWTFNLRQGVTWHDGTPFTSADVVATLDRLAGSNLAAYIVAGASKAIDEHTVEVTLNAPDGQFPYQVGIYNPQSVITPAAFELGSTLDGAPNGTSGFKLKSFDPAVGATFERNDAWWGGKPILDGVEYVFSDDIATLISGLQGGATDALVQFSVVGGEALLADPNVTVESIRGAAHRQIWMNVREGNFTDPKLREAVALGIDRQALIDTILQGRGDLGNDHPIAPVYPFFDASQPQRARDVEKAKALLQESGKADTEFTLHAPKLQEIPQLAELVQSQLAEIGMKITLNVESTDTFYDRWCKVYDSTNEPSGCDGGEEFGIVDYGNRGTPDVYLVKAYATGEWNSSHYVSEEFRAAVSAYQAALDTESRKAPIAEIQKIANADIPYVIPYFYNSLTAYSKKVTGIRATGLGHYYMEKASFTA